MAIFANVIKVNYQPPNTTVDVIFSLLKGIDNAARNGGADFGIHVTLTYISVNGTVETLDSGRKSIQTDTLQLLVLDNHTVEDQLTLSFGTLPVPGAAPSYSSTIQVLHRDSVSGTDVELGPAEQTFT